MDENLLKKATADLVSAYLSNNTIPADEVPDFIRSIYKALSDISDDCTDFPEAVETDAEPAVPIAHSVQPDYIICLECGGKYKSLKRHLQARHGLSPEAYRAKWGLPPDYSMTAAAYSSVRANIAKETYLGSSQES